jgi:hypothetical protein
MLLKYILLIKIKDLRISWQLKYGVSSVLQHRWLLVLLSGNALREET